MANYFALICAPPSSLLVIDYHSVAFELRASGSIPYLIVELILS